MMCDSIAFLELVDNTYQPFCILSLGLFAAGALRRPNSRMGEVDPARGILPKRDTVEIPAEFARIMVRLANGI